MKLNFTFSLIFLLSSTMLQAQLRAREWLAPNFWENKTPNEAANIVFDHIENYYDSAFFSKGVPPHEMSGTGYYPFLRSKTFYQMRRNEVGKIPLHQQWSNFLQFRKKSMTHEKNGKPIANWQPMGPKPISTTLSSGYGGRMISFAFDPQDPNIVYAGAAEGGLWKSLDEGENWQPMTDQLPAVGVSSIAINPSNPNILLIGTGEGKSYISDGILSMKPGLGIFKSYDQGLSWQPTSLKYSLTEEVASYDMIWDAEDTSRVYLAASNGMWISEDGGDRWIRKLPYRMTSVVVKPDNPNTLFAAAEGVGLFKSENKGESWSLINSLPTGSNFRLSILAVCRDFPNFILLSAAGGDGRLLGLFKSSDGGKNWTNLNTPGCYLCSGNNVPLGWYVNAVAVNPADTNRIIVGGTPLYSSISGGNNWSGKSIDLLPQAGRPYIDQHKIVYSPHDDQIVYVVNDGGIAKSINRGVTWTLKNKGIETGQFYSIASSVSDPNFLIGGMQDHGMQRVVNYKEDLTWLKWSFSDGTRALIDPTNPNIIYGQLVSGRKIKSVNGGVSGFAINNGLSGTFSSIWTDFAMDMTNPQTLFTASISQIYKSSNGGSSWIPKGNLPFVKAIAVSTVDHNHVYACGWPYNSLTNNTFWRSTDNGETWQQTASAPGWRAFHIEADPVELGVVYAVSNAEIPNQPRILKSVDHGNSWQDLTNNLPDIGTNDIAINPYNNQHLYLATDFGVFASVNGGVEWFEFNDANLPIVYSLDLHINPTDTTVRVGTQGRSAWLTKAIPIDVFSSTKEERSPTLDFSSLQISPNPGSHHFRLTFDLEKRQNVQLHVFNILGQRLATIADEKLRAGNHEFYWNGQNSNGLDVTNGVYYLQLTLDGIGKMIPLVVQR